MAIITKEDRLFFRENGYIKIPEVVPKADCELVIADIWEFMGKSATDVEGWYTPPTGMDNTWGHQGGGMIELYHRQSMWNNRQNPRVYQAFAELLGEEKLWVSLDRVNMTPPSRKDHPQLDEAFIHWDTDTINLPSPLPHPHGLQGVLYLADTAEDQGGFQCVPSIYRHLEEWIKGQPSDRNQHSPNLDGHEIEKIPGKAGELLIWDQLLPHGNGHNYAEQPRFAQYITMSPAKPEKQDARQAFVNSWRSNASPSWFPGDPRRWEEQNNGHPAELTALGRKLIGLDRWDD